MFNDTFWKRGRLDDLGRLDQLLSLENFLTLHCKHLNHSLRAIPSHNCSEMQVCLGGKKGCVSLEQSAYDVDILVSTLCVCH